MAHDLKKKWRSQDVQLEEDVDFSAMLLSDRVLSGLKKAGFKKPSPIQLEAIPLGRFGKDLLIQSKSGTGKTLVFVIIALEMLKRKLFRPQVMILVPTREIATQICSVVKSVGSAFHKLTCCSFIGGLSLADDKENAVTCQIVVGTPGRLKQLVILKSLPTNSIRLLVFDEADHLIDPSFRQDIEDIFNLLPKDKQVITTSATYPARIKSILFRYLREPHLACLNSRELALLGIVHYAKVVKTVPMPLLLYRNKLSPLEDILKHVKFSQCLVFCNGIQRVEVLHKEIKKWGFSTTYISSAKEQCDRLKAIDRLKHFKCKVLVSSDVVSRGIDAENVDLVINFDLPYTTEIYMHRVGRAGRYGAFGVAISIIDENEIKFLAKMEAEASFKAYKLPDPVPVDLLLKPHFKEYLIEDAEPDSTDTDQKSAAPDEVETDILVHNEVTEKTNFEDVKIKFEQILGTNSDYGDNHVLENLVNTETIPGVSSEIVSNSAKDNSHLLHLKDNIESETSYFDNTDSSKNEAVHSCEKLTDCTESNKCINSFQHENVIDGNINLSLASDCNNSESYTITSDIKICTENIDKKSVGMIIEDPSKLFENKDIIEDAKEGELICQSVSEMKLGDIIGDKIVNQCLNKDDINFDRKSRNISSSDDLSQSYKYQEVSNCIQDTNCKYASNIKLSDNLSNYEMNYIIRNFVNQYETNKNVDSFVLKNEDEFVVKEKAIILDSKIRDFKSKKNDYYYKVFKKYLEGNNDCQTFNSENKIEEKMNEITTMSFQNELHEQESCALDINSTNISPQNLQTGNNLVFDFVDKQNLVYPVEKSEIVSTQEILNKPNSESTPRLDFKSQQSTSESVDVPSCELGVQSRLLLPFEEVSNSSDSSDTELNEEVNLDISQYSSSGSSDEESSSESYDSSENSDEESSYDSFDSSSSEVHVNENIYHHNKFRTGKQNPSLVSNSSGNSLDFEKKANLRNVKKHGKFPKYCSSLKAHEPFCYSCLKKYQQQPSRCSNCKRDFNIKGHKTRGVSVPQNHPGCRTCCRQYCGPGSASCSQPSEHRCHCNVNYSFCNQMPLCSFWYKTFRNQWQHLQRCINLQKKMV